MEKVKEYLMLVALSVVAFVGMGQAQDGVGIGTDSPDEGAALEIYSTNKGLLLPRTNSEPSSLPDGLIYYRNTENRIRIREGGHWSGVIPAGGIIMWSGAYGDIPPGWQLCDGTGDTPNLTGLFIMGGTYGQISGPHGSHSMLLQETHLPSHSHSVGESSNHTHSVTFPNGGSHSHGISDPGHSHSIPSANVAGDGHIKRGHGNNVTHNKTTNSSFTGISVNNGGSHSHSITINAAGNHVHSIGSTGGGQAFDNRPAYYVLAFIMKLP